MRDHVCIAVADRAAAEAFYDTVLATLGVGRTATTDAFTAWGGFRVLPASEDRPPTRGLHIGFAAPDHEHVDAFWRAGVDAGYRDDGAPGPRPQYRDDYYGGFLLDPDGNSAEGVHHGRVGRAGGVDHLWIRVRDVGASQAFYAGIAEQTGFAPGPLLDGPRRVLFRGPSASFSVVEGTPTEHVHLAFAPDGGRIERDPDGNTICLDEELSSERPEG